MSPADLIAARIVEEARRSQAVAWVREAGEWTCPRCGQHPEMCHADWRLGPTGWEHWHGYGQGEVGHVRCEKTL